MTCGLCVNRNEETDRCMLSGEEAPVQAVACEEFKGDDDFDDDDWDEDDEDEDSSDFDDDDYMNEDDLEEEG